jgi:hypothetical protein
MRRMWCLAILVILPAIAAAKDDPITLVPKDLVRAKGESKTECFKRITDKYDGKEVEFKGTVATVQLEAQNLLHYTVNGEISSGKNVPISIYVEYKRSIRPSPVGTQATFKGTAHMNNGTFAIREAHVVMGTAGRQ